MSTVIGPDGRMYNSVTGELETTFKMATAANPNYGLVETELPGGLNARDYIGGGASTGSSDFWTMKGGGGLALSGLQTGIGLLGTLDAMKTAKLQRNLLGQQYDTNAEKMASWRSNTANVKNAFSSGLAASGGL